MRASLRRRNATLDGTSALVFELPPVPTYRVTTPETLVVRLPPATVASGAALVASPALTRKAAGFRSSCPQHASFGAMAVLLMFGLLSALPLCQMAYEAAPHPVQVVVIGAWCSSWAAAVIICTCITCTALRLVCKRRLVSILTPVVVIIIVLVSCVPLTTAFEVSTSLPVHDGPGGDSGASDVVLGSPVTVQNAAAEERGVAGASLLSGTSPMPILSPMPSPAKTVLPSPQAPAKLPPAPPSMALVRRLERRQLATVATIQDLRSHLTLQTSEIELAAGHYLLGGTQLSISHNVAIRAAPGSTVILDAEGDSRVFYISSGTVTLIGLSITGGYVSGVSARVANHETTPMPR